MGDRELGGNGGSQTTELRRTSRDPARMGERLGEWLRARRGPGARVQGLEAPSATGASSDTLLFEAAWPEAGGVVRERLVARLAPDPADVPVFPSYDMARQYEVMRLVRELTAVPVPPVRWLEPDPRWLGAPFLVMERVEGQVPPDVMPYTFGGNWLFDAEPADQRRLQDASLAILAELHAIDRPQERFAFLRLDHPGQTPLRCHVARTWAWYEFATREVPRSPLIERGFRWLEEHWPSHEGPAVLSWGDARIGNVLYRDFQPVAVLDWEMAALGPRELDVGWMLYSHRVFDDMALALGFPGMPHFMRREDVEATYEALTGHAPRDLEFYVTYAAIQFAIVFLRVGLRQARFGGQPLPADVEDLLYNREPLQRMLAGTYWT